MHIKRRYVLQIGVLLLVLATALLAGCAGDADENATTGELREEATELAENDTVEERATMAI